MRLTATREHFFDKRAGHEKMTIRQAVFLPKPNRTLVRSALSGHGFLNRRCAPPSDWSFMIRLTSLRSFFIALAVAATATGTIARDMVAIDRPEVNMRSGAGTQHEAMWVLSKGYPLEVLQRKGKWLQVRDFENDKGWVYRSLTGNKRHHVVKVNTLNIRSGPSTSTKIVGRAVRGEILTTRTRKGDWVKIRQDGGITGWVARRLVWGW